MKQLSLLGTDTQKILVFDIETQRGFDDTKTIRDMGVAAAVAYDYSSEEYKVYEHETTNQLVQDVFEADVVVGYNIIHFDFNVLKGYTDKDFSSVKTVDMMKIVAKELGFRPKLDNLAQATLGETKSANGLQSLEWYRQGMMGKVIEYCKQDVKVTKDLYEFGRDNGFVYANNYGEKVKVQIEW